jgi:hypothetical protein
MQIAFSVLFGLAPALLAEGAAHIERVAAAPDTIVLDIAEGGGQSSRLYAFQLYEPSRDLSSAPSVWEGALTDEQITIPRYGENHEDRLYRRFVLAGADGRTLGPPRCVTDLEALPRPDFAFPWPACKKGVSDPSLREDVLALGAQYVALNFMLSSVLKREGNAGDTYWEVDGERFAINTDYLARVDEKVKYYTDAGINVTLIVLNHVPQAADPANPMIHPATDLANAPFHLGAFNLADMHGLRAYRAAIECAAQRYSRPDAAHGWVSGYIIGNEVNSHWDWYNIGRMALPDFVEQYGRALRTADLAVRQAHPDARVYVSLEHHWTATFRPDATMSFGAKPFLERLSAWSKAEGDFPWHIAFHPYPEDLYDPCTWEDRQTVLSFLTPKITFKNIEVLPAFLRQGPIRYEGAPRRVIFSEQGFQTLDSADGEDLQAAAFAYSWNKVRDLDGIDAYMYFSQVDFDWPGGLRVGLWSQEKDAQGRSRPGKKKRIHDVLRAAGTPEWDQAAAFALPIIGAKNWADATPSEDIETTPCLAPELTLIKDGLPLWQIVVPADAAPSVHYASKELQHFLREMSGAELPIVTEDTQAPLPSIHLRIDAGDPRLREDGVAITTGPDLSSLTLAGQNGRGVIYSVYSLLERYLGVRFLAKDCVATPKRETVTLPRIDYVHTPPFMYRETLYFDSFPKEISVRQRLNGPYSQCDEEVGGKWAFFPYVHSFNKLVPPEEYFEEHPEYFSLIDGKRTAGAIHAQLCLTNPEVLAIAKERVFQWIEEHPDVPIIDVSQNDGNGWCECEQCAKVVEEEGSQHGPILRFVNAIADAVAERYPDKWIETLAYAYSTKPPAVTTPRDNVIIRLCHAGCYFHGFEQCGLGANLTAYLDQWSKVTKRIFIWHYTTNFAHYIAPNQNLRGLAKDLKYYAAHGVNGVMVQGNYQGSGGELAEIRQYLAAQLMWDPEQDAQRIICDFCNGYYGAAAHNVLEYLALLDKTAENPDVHAFGAWDPKDTVPPELVEKGLAVLAQSRAHAGDDVTVRGRVERLLLPLWYMQLTYPERYGLDEADAPRLLTEFEKVAHREQATYINEGKRMDDWLAERKTE